MSNLPSTPSENVADHFWNKQRIRLAVLAVILIGILIVAVLVSLGPTICCTVFSNIVNSI